MVQPIRPQDVSNVYRQQAASTGRVRPGQGGLDPGTAAGAQGTQRADRVQLSEEAQQLRRVLDSIATHPELREQRIAELREQIASGTYDRGFAAIASRLVDEGLVQ